MNNNLIRKVQQVFAETEPEYLLESILDVMWELDFPHALLKKSLYNTYKTTLGWFIIAPEEIKIEVNTWTQKICVFVDNELIEELNNPQF